LGCAGEECRRFLPPRRDVRVLQVAQEALVWEFLRTTAAIKREICTRGKRGGRELRFSRSNNRTHSENWTRWIISGFPQLHRNAYKPFIYSCIRNGSDSADGLSVAFVSTELETTICDPSSQLVRSYSCSCTLRPSWLKRKIGARLPLLPRLSPQ
jgi:hypothetical protein